MNVIPSTSLWAQAQAQAQAFRVGSLQLGYPSDLCRPKSSARRQDRQISQHLDSKAGNLHEGFEAEGPHANLDGDDALRLENEKRGFDVRTDSFVAQPTMCK